MNKLPVSVLVASCNEGHMLEDCLRSLQFCDEIFGIDLQSDDNSMELFRKYATQVETFQRVPMIERVHPHFIDKLKHDWIILIDPDERIMPALAASISEELQKVEPEIAALRVPMINHFKGRALKGTTYGGIIYARLLYRRSGITVDDDVHKGIKLRPGFDRKKIRFTGENYDKHLWCNSWKQLADKHRRYLLGEGQARYNEGLRHSFKEQWMAFFRTFYFSFKGLKGYKDGLTGLMISFMEARYEFLSWAGLKAYQRTIQKQ